MTPAAFLSRVPRRVVAIGLAAILASSAAGIAIATIVSDPGPFTGCLASKTVAGTPATKGLIYNVAKGGSPLAACVRGDLQVTFSNAKGLQGDPGQRGPRGEPGSPALLRWNFALSTSPGDGTSTTEFPSEAPPEGATVEIVSASLTVGTLPPECARLDVIIDFATAPNHAVDWIDVSTLPGTYPPTGTATSLLGTYGPSAATDPVHIQANCRDDSHNPVAGPVELSGNVVMKVTYPPVDIP